MKTDHIFMTYRCRQCQRVVTKLQVLSMMSGQTGRLCACGGSQIAPCDLAGLDWLLGPWSSAPAYTSAPAARASFGLFRSESLLRRELY